MTFLNNKFASNTNVSERSNANITGNDVVIPLKILNYWYKNISLDFNKIDYHESIFKMVTYNCINCSLINNTLKATGIQVKIFFAMFILRFITSTNDVATLIRIKSKTVIAVKLIQPQPRSNS